MVRFAVQTDLDFLDQHDPLLKRQSLSEKIDRKEVYVAESRGRSVGLARYNYFCDLDPFLTLIFVLEPYRRQGFGSQLIQFWEQAMKEKGHRYLLTCTQADEDAQFFYRKLGFADTGSMLFPGQTAAELILLKNLSHVDEPAGTQRKEGLAVSLDMSQHSQPKNLKADVTCELSPPVSNEELRELFMDAWPHRQPLGDYLAVLQHGLGYVCAFKGGELVGFANAAWDGGAHVFLLDTTVRSGFRHHGIGRQLVRQIEELARKSGAEWLHVDFELRYEQFYRKCGFRESRAGLIYLK